MYGLLFLVHLKNNVVHRDHEIYSQHLEMEWMITCWGILYLDC